MIAVNHGKLTRLNTFKFRLATCSEVVFATINTHAEVSYFLIVKSTHTHTPQAPWFRSANILQCKFPGRQGTPATGSRTFAKGTFQFQNQVSATVAKQPSEKRAAVGFTNPV